jgi:hypothetical protein
MRKTNLFGKFSTQNVVLALVGFGILVWLLTRNRVESFLDYDAQQLGSIDNNSISISVPASVFQSGGALHGKQIKDVRILSWNGSNYVEMSNALRGQVDSGNAQRPQFFTGGTLIRKPESTDAPTSTQKKFPLPASELATSGLRVTGLSQVNTGIPLETSGPRIAKAKRDSASKNVKLRIVYE